MDGELYRLPGRRSERRRIWVLTALGLLLAGISGSWVATQWIAHTHEEARGFEAPLLDLGPSEAQGLLAASAAPVIVWAVAWARSRSGPGTWGWLILALIMVAVASLPVYRPDGAWRWARAGKVPEPLIGSAAASGLATFSVLALWIGCWSRQALGRVPKAGETHGSAHYATTSEVAATGFLSPVEDGVVLGCYQGRRLRCLKDQHVLLFSPPGAGKSTALAVPTLLTWRSSVFVLDAKGELFDLTAGYRQHSLGQKVCRMDFTLSLIHI